MILVFIIRWLELVQGVPLVLVLMVTHYCCARMKENGAFRVKNIRFVTALDVIKCLLTGRITNIAPYVRTS